MTSAATTILAWIVWSATSLIGIICAYKLSTYISNGWFTEDDESYHLICFPAVASCILFCNWAFWYEVYVLLLLIWDPDYLFYKVGGTDPLAFKKGLGKYNLIRLYNASYAKFQEFSTFLFVRPYFQIGSFYKKCQNAASVHCLDLNKLKYSELCARNDKITKHISNWRKEICENTKSVQSSEHTTEKEMISIFNIHYDEQDPDQLVNIFLPATVSPTPVIIFIVGGGYSSCDSIYSASAASSFVKSKIAFVYPTYTTYPIGNIDDMVNNINAIIAYTIKYASIFNIDPNKIGITGQSAGAHISVMSVFQAFQKKSQWLKRVKLWCGVSGLYDLHDAFKTAEYRGTSHISPVGRANKGYTNYDNYSPSIRADNIFKNVQNEFDHSDKNERLQEIGSSFPFMLLLHTKPDYICRVQQSQKLNSMLQRIKVRTEFMQYGKGSHYDTLFAFCDKHNHLFHDITNEIISHFLDVCEN